MTSFLRTVGGSACCAWAVVFGVVFVGTREPWFGVAAVWCAGLAWLLLGGMEES